MMINPKGFQKIAPEISPFRIEITDRVDPQEGQGIPVTRLNKQTPKSDESEMFR
jgi:hypothetical protein